MTCRRTFNCNFCKCSITDASAGIGVKWSGSTELKPVYLDAAETHLCSTCVKALPTLFAELELLNKIHRDRDAMELNAEDPVIADYERQRLEDAAESDRLLAENDDLRERVAVGEAAMTSETALAWEAGRLRARVAELEAAQPVWRHIKRGTTYRQIGQASLQCTGGCGEGAVLVVYQGDDGKMWARPYDEFHDGRFERAAALEKKPDGAEGK